jgi:hypothetical membrane protein
VYPSAWAGMALTAIAVTTVMALEVTCAAESPWRRTISEYGLGPNGWIFGMAVGLAATGSMAISVSLRRRRTTLVFSVGILVLITWSAGLAVIAIFPMTDWSVGPSLHGNVHYLGCIIAFVSLPIAALLIGSRSWHLPYGRAVTWLGAASLLWMIGIVYLLTMALSQGLSWDQATSSLGLVERGFVLTAFATLFSLGLLAVGPVRHRLLILEESAYMTDHSNKINSPFQTVENIQEKLSRREPGADGRLLIPRPTKLHKFQ